MNDNILVLGANGKAGAEVTNSLAKKGFKVKAGVRNLEKGKSLETGNVHPILLDLDEPGSFRPALEGVSGVFIQVPPMDPDGHLKLEPFIDEAVRSGINKFVLMTAMGVDQEEESPLRNAELKIEASGKNYTILRPNWFNQNFNSIYVEMINAAGGLYLPAGDGKVSFIDTRDIGSCAAESFMTDDLNGAAVTITGPEAITHEETASLISKVAGKEIGYTPITDELFRETLAKQGFPEFGIKVLAGLFNYVRDGYTSVVTDGVKNITGKEPISFEQYVEDYSENWS